MDTKTDFSHFRENVRNDAKHSIRQDEIHGTDYTRKYLENKKKERDILVEKLAEVKEVISIYSDALHENG